MLLDWRNTEQVRRYMYSSHRIAEHEHQAWFRSLCDDANRHAMIFELDGVPSGFVNFGSVVPGRVANWGFYAAPAAPRGTGRMLGRSALSYAFADLKLHKVCGEALDFNEASRRLHLSLGFRQEGVLIQQHFDGVKYHDVIRFGIIAAEWSAMALDASNEATT